MDLSRFAGCQVDIVDLFPKLIACKILQATEVLAARVGPIDLA